MNTKKILGVVAVLALVAVAMVGAGAAANFTEDKTVTSAADFATILGSENFEVSNNIVTMKQDVTFDDGKKLIVNLSGTDAVTLDLGTHTLQARVNLEKGDLTIMNGTVTTGSYADGQPINVYGSATETTNYSVLTIADTAKVSGQKFGVCLFGPAYTSHEGYGAVINIAGTVRTNGTGSEGAVFVSGNLGISATDETNTKLLSSNIITITGTVSSALDAGVALNGAATVNVNAGANISGNTGIAVKRGLLNVAGGTVTGTGTFVENPVKAGSGTEMTGAAISLTSGYSNNGTLGINLTGGNLVATGSGAPAFYIGESKSGSSPVSFVNAAATTINCSNEVTMKISASKTLKSSGKIAINLGTTANVNSTNTWDEFKDYITTAAEGANVKTTDASKTFDVAYTGTEDIDECVDDVSSTGGNTVVNAGVTMKYYVYIPSGVTLGSTAQDATYKVEMKNVVTTSDDRKVRVALTGASHLDSSKNKYVTLNDSETAADNQKMKYTVAFKNDIALTDIQLGTEIVSVNVTSEDPESTVLTYSKVDMTGKQAGNYKDTLTFAVSVY